MIWGLILLFWASVAIWWWFFLSRSMVSGWVTASVQFVVGMWYMKVCRAVGANVIYLIVMHFDDVSCGNTVLRGAYQVDQFCGPFALIIFVSL
jgi:hypothetical protein